MMEARALVVWSRSQIIDVMIVRKLPRLTEHRATSSKVRAGDEWTREDIILARSMLSPSPSSLSGRFQTARAGFQAVRN